MAGIKVATVVYDWHELDLSKHGTATIGEQVDAYIQDCLAHEKLVQSVSVEFDEIEANRMLRDYYGHAEATPKKR